MPQSYSPVYFPADYSIASMGANNTGVDVPVDSTSREVTIYPCLDPVTLTNASAVISQNNLRFRSHNAGAHHGVRTNIGISGTDKVYWEVVCGEDDVGNWAIGVGSAVTIISNSSGTAGSFSFIQPAGNTWEKFDTSTSSRTLGNAAGTVWGYAVDYANQDLYLSKNGEWWNGSAFSGTTGPGTIWDDTLSNSVILFPIVKGYNQQETTIMRFSSNSWSYSAPSTYTALTNTMTGVGNYATLNPHATNGNGTVSRGNLNFTVGSTSNSVAGSTIGVSSGKFYGEVTYNANAGGAASFGFGIASSTSAVLRKGSGNYLGQGSDSHGINATNGNLTSNGSVTVSSYAGGALVDGTTYMWCLDMDNGKWWAGNAETNTWFTNSGVGNPATGANAGVTGLDGIIQICASAYNGDGVDMNFGQTPLVNQASIPSGFKTLKTTNLPTPSVANVDNGYVQVLNTGANIQSALATARSGYSTYMEVFKDLDSTTIWQVRFSDDTGNGLDFESTAAKTSFAAPSGSNNFLGWAFNMNATHGMFTAEVSHDTGSDTNTAHSLGAGLKMAVVKITNTTGGWYWSHPGMTSGHNIEWNQHTNGEQNGTVYAGIDDTNVIVKSAAPTGTYRVIAIVEVAGFSSLATMVGNGANDGPFVYTGMQPEFMVCRRHTGGVNTFAYVPQGQNPENTLLEFDDPGGTSIITGGSKDFCATGFKVPETSNDFNASGVRNFIWSIGRVTGGTGVAQAKAR